MKKPEEIGEIEPASCPYCKEYVSDFACADAVVLAELYNYPASLVCKCGKRVRVYAETFYKLKADTI